MNKLLRKHTPGKNIVKQVVHSELIAKLIGWYYMSVSLRVELRARLDSNQYLNLSGEQVYPLTYGRTIQSSFFWLKTTIKSLDRTPMNNHQGTRQGILQTWSLRSLLFRSFFNVSATKIPSCG